MNGVIFEDVAKLLDESGKNASELSKIFNRERKSIYSLKNGCCFRVDYEILHGFAELGYTVALVNIKTGEVYNR